MKQTNYMIHRVKAPFLQVSRFIGRLAFVAALLIFSLPTSAENWESIGMGKLIDGWFIGSNAQNTPLEVEMQRDKDNPNRYRLLQPYKDLETIAKVKNTSNYKELGEIVIDLSDPEWIIIEGGHPSGVDNAEIKVKNFPPDTATEYACMNVYGYYISLMGGGTGNTSFAKSLTDASAKSSYDEEEKVIMIPKPVVSDIKGSIQGTQTNTAYIYFPEDFDPGAGIPTPEEKEYDAANWQVLGMGKLIDGWVTEGVEFDVEIDQDVNNPNRYRVWNPYKDLEEKTGKKNNSKYCGQIVFDVTYPDLVLVEYEKPIGYYFDGSGVGYPGEMYACNGLSYYIAYFEQTDKTLQQLESMGFLSSMKNNYIREYTTTYEDGVVTIAHAQHLSSPDIFRDQKPTDGIGSVKIIMPKSPEQIWEEEEGQWESIGTGTLVDGWVTNGQEFEVDIQQNIENPKRFRVWNPYKELEGANSAYRGQIVFDISEPDLVRVEFGKPIGYKYSGGSFKGEIYPVNDFGYLYKLFDAENDPEMLDIIKGQLSQGMAPPSTYEGWAVTIQAPKFMDADFELEDPIEGAGEVAKIIFPKVPVVEKMTVNAVSVDGTINKSNLKTTESLDMTLTLEPAEISFRDIVWSADVEDAVEFDIPEEGDGTEFTVTVKENAPIGEVNLIGRLTQDCDWADDITVTYTINISQLIPGDANDSGSISVADVVTVRNVILEHSELNDNFCFMNSDLDGNKEIDVADQTAVGNLVLGKPAFGVSKIASAPMAYGDDLKAENFDLNEETAIAFDLENAGRYVILQADVKLPQGAKLIGIEAGEKAQSHILAYNTIDNETLRVLVYSLSNTPFGTTGSLFTITADTSHARGDIEVSNVIASDSRASRYELGFHGGLNSEIMTSIDQTATDGLGAFGVEGAVKVIGAEGKEVKVYSLDGRLIGYNIATGTSYFIEVEKGVYMVTVDGKSFKVLVK